MTTSVFGAGPCRRAPAAAAGCKRLLFAMLLVVALPRSLLGVPHASDPWVRVRTAHFDLVGEVPVAQLRRIGVRLERFRAVLHRGRAQDVSDDAIRVIVVFKGDASFRSYKLQENGSPANYEGVFVSSPGRRYIGMNGDPEEDPYAIIYHEYVHDDLQRRYGSIPLWLNEGFAEYYSTFRMNENRVEIGRAVEHHVRVLHERPLVPFDEFFAIDANSPDYHEGERQGMFYAQSWAFVHYCLQGSNGMADKLQKFLDAAAAGTPTADAFQRAFEMDYDAMESALVDYARGGQFPYRRIELDGLKVDERAEPVPLARPDLLQLLGDYVLASARWRVGFAEEHFREALRLDPNHARAQAGLGSCLAAQKRWVQAQEHFDRAIDLDRDDTSLFLQYGLAQLQHAGGDSVPVRPRALPPGIEAARGLLGRCLEMDERMGEAHFGIAQSYLFDPADVGPGIAAIERARELLPARPDIDYTLILLLLRQDDRASAQQVADRLVAYARDPAVVEQVKVAFAEQTAASEVERYDAILEMLNRGDLDRGIQALEALIASAQKAEVRTAAQETLAQAKTDREQQQAARVLTQQIERYNQAVELANGGDLRGASRMLDALAPEVTDPELASQVGDFRRRISEAMSSGRGR